MPLLKKYGYEHWNELFLVIHEYYCELDLFKSIWQKCIYYIWCFAVNSKAVTADSYYDTSMLS